MALKKPVGAITRGTTHPNRLRRVDRFISTFPQIKAEDALVVDLGFGATLVKELAKSQKLVSEKEYEKDLLKTLEFFYWILSLLIIGILFFISPWISTNWLKIEKLNSKDVSLILILMSFSLGFQFPFSLYSNGLLGLNKQFTLNIIIILGNILRHLIGVFIVLKYNNLIYFFKVSKWFK